MTPDTTDRAAALKACPFCGGAALLSDGYAPFVSCRKCHAQTDQMGPRDHVIALWNARPEAPAPQPAREIDWEAKFREAQDADQASGLEAEEYREVLEDIRQTLCDAACPTQWVTAEGRPHCDACKKVTAILASYPGWERGPSPTPVSVEEASRVDRRLLDVPFDAPVRAPNPASEAGAAGEDELRRITGALKAKFPALTSDFLYDIARAAIRAGAEVHANTKPDFLHEGQDVKEKLDELQRRAEQAEAERDQARAEVAILRRVRQAAIDVVSAKDWMCYEPIEARRKRDDALRDAIHGIQRDEAGKRGGERLNTADGEASMAASVETLKRQQDEERG